MTLVEISTVAGNISFAGAASAALVIYIWKWPKIQAQRIAAEKMQLEHRALEAEAAREHSRLKSKTQQEMQDALIALLHREMAAQRRQCWTETMALIRLLAPGKELLPAVAEAMRSYPGNDSEETPRPDDSEREMRTPA